MPDRLTFNASLAAFLKDRPHQWIDGIVLAQIAGCYAYRTRISNLRKRFGMTILNRQRRVSCGERARIVSEYCYEPAAMQTEDA